MKRKNILLLLAALLVFSLACNFASEMGKRDNTEETAPAENLPEATPLAESGDNPCKNVLYPLIPDSQLIYKNRTAEGETQIGLTVSKVEDSQDTIDMLDMSTGIITQSTIGCEAGAIKSYPLVKLDTLFGDIAEGEMNMDYVSGVIAPSEDTLIANNWAMNWQSEYVMNGEMTFTDQGESMTINIDNSPVTMDWRVDSTGQSLSVPAGTFNNVVVVKREMAMQVSINMGGFPLKSDLTLESTHWFEPHIGMLKMTVDAVTAEFQGMTFPVPTDQVMELTEIRPAE